MGWETFSGLIIERTEPEIKSEVMIVAQAWLDAAEVVSLPCEYPACCRGADVRVRPPPLLARWTQKVGHSSRLSSATLI
jgi:hypothetical protein